MHLDLLGAAPSTGTSVIPAGEDVGLMAACPSFVPDPGLHTRRDHRPALMSTWGEPRRDGLDEWLSNRRRAGQQNNRDLPHHAPYATRHTRTGFVQVHRTEASKHFTLRPCAAMLGRWAVVRNIRALRKPQQHQVGKSWIVEWSGAASSSPTPTKSRNASESATRQAMPRSESVPSR